MSKSTKSRRGNKPAKPHPDFPLIAHNNGQWCKKVKGKVHYFGSWNDPDAALAKWLEQKDDLLAGRTPRPKSGELTVKQLADRYLTAKLNRVRNGELSQYSYRDYVDILQRMADVFGKHRPVVDLRADDFESLRNEYAKTHGPARLRKDITTVRSVFNYAFECELIDVPIRFGPGFKPPGKTALLKARRANGRKDFTADESRRILDALDGKVELRAMFLLGLNAALGNTDVAELRTEHLDLDNGWLDFPRVKTLVDRRAKLWPETVSALQDVLANRPKAADPADADCVFLTPQGAKYCRLKDDGVRIDAIGRAFGRLLKQLDINSRRNFYSARHTFRTQAANAKDEPAADLVMGHSPDSMASVYTHGIDDARMEAVAECVREWLFGDGDTK